MPCSPCGDPPFEWGPVVPSFWGRWVTNPSPWYVTTTSFVPTSFTVTVDTIDDQFMVSASHWGMFEMPRGIRS